MIYHILKNMAAPLDYSDAKLVALYLNGDQSSLDFLINRHLKAIYRFIYYFVRNSKEAEDLTQEVFVKVWRHLKKFDQTRNFKTWIFRVAKNTALDFLKKKKIQLFSELEVDDKENSLIDRLVDPEPLPPAIFAQKELSQVLDSALQKLSPESRLILLLHYKEDHTLKQIAEILEKPVDTVKSRHRRALMLLRKFITKEPDHN